MIERQEIARALLRAEAVGFSPKNPITFKSGIISPVYVDNRRLPHHPQEWKIILDGLVTTVIENKLDFDVIAGIETAGIPHSAALGYKMQQPSVFVRKKIKDHGTKSRVEGGPVAKKKVLLIEDHVTTGESSLAGVQALRDEKAIVKTCLSITSYGFLAAKKAFAAEKVQLHTLVSFLEILEEAVAEKRLNLQEKLVIENWMKDPFSWRPEFAV